MLLTNRRVLLRVDINVPISNGQISEDTRIKEIIPTIQVILGQNPKQLTILAHQGRSKERSIDSTLDLHAKILERLLSQKITKVNDWTGQPTSNSKILLLENLRLSNEDALSIEKREAFAKLLSTHGDVYINDAFAVCHRDHASISQLPKLMSEKAAGLLLEKEINALHSLLEQPSRPLTLILGGAKLETKLPLIQNFVQKADHFLLGGGIANTFLSAAKVAIGSSLYEPNMVEMAKKLLSHERQKLVIPVDARVEREASSQTVNLVDGVDSEDKILDIGPQTINAFRHVISESETIVWNGPLGYFEDERFRNGSIAIAKALSESNAKVIIGGGDTIAVLNKAGLSFDTFHHVSTGGGAMLEYLSGKEMPGLSALN